MASANLELLDSIQLKKLISERLQELTGRSPEEAQKVSDKIYSHYSRLRVLPKTLETLDVSLRALNNMWASNPKALG